MIVFVRMFLLQPGMRLLLSTRRWKGWGGEGGEEKNSDVTLYFWAPVALCTSAMAMV